MTFSLETFSRFDVTTKLLVIFASTLFLWYLSFELRSYLIYSAIRDGRVSEIVGKPLISQDILNKGLQHAYALKKKDAFKVLLDEGANPDSIVFCQNSWGRIGVFAISSKDPFWIESLLAKGLDLSKITWREASPIIHAISAESEASAAVLLRHGAEIQHIGKTMTPLNYAAQMRQPKIFEMLIAYNADINFPGFSGRTFFDAFVIMGFADTDWKIDDLDPLMDDFVEAMKICNLDPNNLRFNAQPKSVGKWEFGKLRPDEEQTFDIRKPFIELRLKRPESIYNDPEKWGIVEKLKPYLPAKNVEEANPPK